MMLTQYVLNKGSEENEDDAIDAISADDIYSWRDDWSEREFDIESDVKFILNNQIPSTILQALSAYSNYLSDKAEHYEDFIRDACQRLVQKESPFKDNFIDAYKMSYGTDYSDDCVRAELDSGALVVDDIVSYFSFGDLDQNSTYNFIYSYLACLANDSSIVSPKI